MACTRTAYIFWLHLFATYVPRWWLRIQNRVVSYGYYLFLGRVRRAVQANLAPVLGLPPDHARVKAATRRLFRNYGLYLMDYVTMAALTTEQFRDKIHETHGLHHMAAALEAGKGAILITPHLGNWELGGLSFAARGCPIHVLTIKDPATEVQEYRDSLRGNLGMSTLHVTPEDPSVILKLARLLRENQVVAMLGDRYEGGRQCQVTFFGRRVVFPAGAAALSQVTGAPILPVFVVLRPDGGYEAWLEEPIRATPRAGHNDDAITANIQELARVFERVIARHPDQWFHFSNYWERYGCEHPAG